MPLALATALLEKALPAMFKRLVTLAFCLALTACASREMPGALVPVEMAAPNAATLDLLVASSRGISRTTGVFDSSRAKTVNYQRLKLSIPPDHKTGEIEWPKSLPGDPEKHFVSLANDMFDETQLTARLNRMIPASGQVLVFIHGYNTTHEEGVFRLAQIAHDAKLDALPVLFSWPSRGAVKDYLTDRESALSARTRLLHFLSVLSRHPRVKNFDVLAHSMGTMLTMETLMLAKLAGNPDFSGKMNTLILAAPDIDVDVFLAQFEVIGRRKGQTAIMTSRDDKALQLSRRLAGDVVRVGASSATAKASVEAIKKYGFTVVDLTELASGDAANHTKFASSPLIVQKLGARVQDGNSDHAGGLPGVGAFFVDAAGHILDAPSTVLREITQR